MAREDVTKIVMVRPDGFIKIITNPKRVGEILESGVQKAVSIDGDGYIIHVIMEADFIRCSSSDAKITRG